MSWWFVYWRCTYIFKWSNILKVGDCFSWFFRFWTILIDALTCHMIDIILLIVIIDEMLSWIKYEAKGQSICCCNCFLVPPIFRKSTQRKTSSGSIPDKTNNWYAFSWMVFSFHPPSIFKFDQRPQVDLIQPNHISFTN